jgi:hypothetical protein
VGRPGGVGGVGVGRPGGVGGVLPGLGVGTAIGVGTAGLGQVARSNNVGSRNSYTRAVNRQALVNQGTLVRNGFDHYGCFHGNWWGAYPGAWRAAGWVTAASVWRAATWASCATWCGYPAQPVYYDYGTNVVYEGDNVYINGDSVGTQQQYAQEAITIADTGKTAEATKEEEWLSLGVFAMVQGQGTDSNDLFQLAVNKAGTIRGNYYNAIGDKTVPVYGSVDKKTQRAAWTVGDRKDPIYETGFANLTKSETTMLVHFGQDRTQQWTLIRVDQRADKKE